MIDKNKYIFYKLLLNLKFYVINILLYKFEDV